MRKHGYGACSWDLMRKPQRGEAVRLGVGIPREYPCHTEYEEVSLGALSFTSLESLFLFLNRYMREILEQSSGSGLHEAGTSKYCLLSVLLARHTLKYVFLTSVQL